MTVLTLTGVIIAISYIPGMDRAKGRVLETVFGTGYTEAQSGVTRSVVFPSIEKLVFDRASDSISFFASSGTQMVALPSGQIYERLPYATTTISNIAYTISADGIVTKDTGTVMGKAILPQDMSRAIVMFSGSDVVSLSRSGIRTMSGEYTRIEEIVAMRE